VLLGLMIAVACAINPVSGRRELALVSEAQEIEMGLELLPPEPERLWNLNAVRVPENRVEAKVRACLLEDHDIEVGAGLGPLAGRIWRVGLMGSGAKPENVKRLLSAMPAALMVGRKN